MLKCQMLECSNAQRPNAPSQNCKCQCPCVKCSNAQKPNAQCQMCKCQMLKCQMLTTNAQKPFFASAQMLNKTQIKNSKEWSCMYGCMYVCMYGLGSSWFCCCWCFVADCANLLCGFNRMMEVWRAENCTVMDFDRVLKVAKLHLN